MRICRGGFMLKILYVLEIYRQNPPTPRLSVKKLRFGLRQDQKDNYYNKNDRDDGNGKHSKISFDDI